MSANGVPEAYQSPEGLRTLANYLRSQNGVKVRSGIEHEKRVDYFKGKRLIECLLEAKKWPKSIPQITDKGVARLVAQELIQSSFFHRSDKVEDKKGYLQISKRNVFEESGHYTWMYSGNMVWSNLASVGIVVAIITCTLMPIWPESWKKVLWYCSVTFLILTLSFCLTRFVAFLVMWLLGYDFWVFPRLFDDSLSFQDSFKPIYSFEVSAPGQMYYRIGLLVGITGFVYWACTQPTEFDGFLKANKDFIDDLYSGNLLADVAHNTRENIDRQNKRVPNLEDLLREMEMDLLEEKKGAETVQNQNSSGSESDFSTLTETIERARSDGDGAESSAMDEHLLDEILQQHSQEDDAADGA